MRVSSGHFGWLLAVTACLLLLIGVVGTAFGQYLKLDCIILLMSLILAWISVLAGFSEDYIRAKKVNLSRAALAAIVTILVAVFYPVFGQTKIIFGG